MSTRQALRSNTLPADRHPGATASRISLLCVCLFGVLSASRLPAQAPLPAVNPDGRIVILPADRDEGTVDISQLLIK